MHLAEAPHSCIIWTEAHGKITKVNCRRSWRRDMRRVAAAPNIGWHGKCDDLPKCQYDMHYRNVPSKTLGLNIAIMHVTAACHLSALTWSFSHVDASASASIVTPKELWQECVQQIEKVSSIYLVASGRLEHCRKARSRAAMAWLKLMADRSLVQSFADYIDLHLASSLVSLLWLPW